MHSAGHAQYVEGHDSCLQICMNMLRAGIIANRVDISEQMFPGVLAAALFIGTVAASGGKLLVDLIQHLTGELKGQSACATPSCGRLSTSHVSILWLSANQACSAHCQWPLR